MTQEEAIEIAEQFGLENEVKYAIEVLELTPEEALEEWDL